MGPGAVAGAVAVAASPELAPIELYTAEARIVGWIAAGGRRVTDLLREHEVLRLWQPRSGTPEAGATAPPSTDGGEWQTIETRGVVLAMPPEWRAARQLRLHRRLQRVALDAGPFSVTGNLHLAPDADLAPAGADLPAFIPLTDAHILHRGEPSFEHVVSVVIVNAAHVTRMVALVRLA